MMRIEYDDDNEIVYFYENVWKDRYVISIFGKDFSIENIPEDSEIIKEVKSNPRRWAEYLKGVALYNSYGEWSYKRVKPRKLIREINDMRFYNVTKMDSMNYPKEMYLYVDGKMGITINDERVVLYWNDQALLHNKYSKDRIEVLYKHNKDYYHALLSAVDRVIDKFGGKKHLFTFTKEKEILDWHVLERLDFTKVWNFDFDVFDCDVLVGVKDEKIILYSMVYDNWVGNMAFKIDEVDDFLADPLAYVTTTIFKLPDDFRFTRAETTTSRMKRYLCFDAAKTRSSFSVRKNRYCYIFDSGRFKVTVGENTRYYTKEQFMSALKEGRL